LLTGTINILLLLNARHGVLLAALHVIQQRHDHFSSIGILHGFTGRLIPESRQLGMQPVCPMGIQHLVHLFLNFRLGVYRSNVFLRLPAWPVLGFTQHRHERVNLRGFVPDVAFEATFNFRFEAIRAVLCGRAYAYGLAAAGEAGVARALAILRADVEHTLKLLGCPSVAALDRSYVEVSANWRRVDA
jgi:hypothetical protein